MAREVGFIPLATHIEGEGEIELRIWEIEAEAGKSL